jgi:hypothetical protein
MLAGQVGGAPKVDNLDQCVPSRHLVVGSWMLLPGCGAAWVASCPALASVSCAALHQWEAELTRA